MQDLLVPKARMRTRQQLLVIQLVTPSRILPALHLTSSLNSWLWSLQSLLLSLLPMVDCSLRYEIFLSIFSINFFDLFFLSSAQQLRQIVVLRREGLINDVVSLPLLYCLLGVGLLFGWLFVFSILFLCKDLKHGEKRHSKFSIST